ncbi:MAG: DNA cytosine methyltransferase [Bacteroidales bacterium]|nr:DNA cytosine methyltransferase [Bacteroidales bacterium]
MTKDKAYCLKHQAGNARDYFKKHHTDIKFEPVGTTKDGKSFCFTAGYANGSGENIGNHAVHTLEKGCKSMAAEPVCVAQRGRYTDSGNRTVKGNGPIEQYYEARDDGKTNVLTTVQKDNAVCEPVNTTVDGKSFALTSSYYKCGENPFSEFGEEKRRPRVVEPIRIGCMPSPDGKVRNSQAFRVYSTDGKSVNLTSGGGGAGGKTGLYAIQIDNQEPRCYATPCEWDEDGRPIKAVSCADGKVYTVYEVKDGKITIKGKEYPIKLVDGYYIIRKLTVRECMRLQTVPEWYEFPVSDTQAYKMLGNGWTVEVIRHLIRCAVKDGEQND